MHLPNSRILPLVPSLGLAFFACGGEPIEPPVPVAIANASESYQMGKSGEWLSKPLRVQVTDDQGRGVRGVEVSWRIVSGSGQFAAYGLNVAETDVGVPLSTFVKPTDPGGIARVLFRPTAVGLNTVVAEAVGVRGSPVAFVTEAKVTVVHMGFLSACPGSPSTFEGPDGSPDVIVPVGTFIEWVRPQWLIEWVGDDCVARITATSTPPGGEVFDSGILRFWDQFEFVPRVVGTWEFTDQINGGAGRIIAQ